MMRVARFEEKGGNLKFVEVPLPEPGAGQVRIKVTYCGVCHTDLFSQGHSEPGYYPKVPGHEAVGVVDVVGKDVKAFKPGDRVGVGWFGGSCHECAVCLRHNNWVGCPKVVATGGSVDGGFATHMVANADALARIPDKLSDEEAAPLLCAGITTFNALRHVTAKAGDLVAVIGIGGLGHLGVQYAVKMGFNVVAVSRGTDKKELALKLGAHHYIDSAAEDPVKALKALGGARVILDTAGNSKLIETLIEGLGYDGELVLGALSPDPISFVTWNLMKRRAKIFAWPSGDARDIQDTLDFSVVTGVKSINEVFSFDNIQAAWDRMVSTKAQFRVVVKI